MKIKYSLVKPIMYFLFTLALVFHELSIFCQTAYVPSEYLGKVYVIDIASNTVTATINVGNGPNGVSVSPDGSKVYVTNSQSNSVSVINTSNNSIISTIPVGNGPYGIAYNPDGSKVYVTNYYSSTISVINTMNNNVIDTITVGLNPRGIIVSPNGSKIYVVNYSDHTVSVIDAINNIVIKTIPIGDIPYWIAINPNGSNVYVSGDDYMRIIDTSNDSLLNINVSLDWGRGIVVSPDNSKIYVAIRGSDKIKVINAITFSTITYIPVGSYPSGVSINADGTNLLVTNYGDSNVKRINTTTNSVTATISVGNLPTAFGNFIASNVFTSCKINPDELKISTYPNPFSDAIVFQTNNELCNAIVRIINNFGQISEEVININGNSFVLERKGLQAGIYFAQIIQNGKIVSIQKIAIVD